MPVPFWPSGKFDSQCYGWAGYFVQIMRVQGFDYPLSKITITDKKLNFMINNWKVVNQEKMYNLVDPAGIVNGGAHFVPINANKTGYKFTETNISDEDGLAGQNNANPSSLFNNHSLVVVGTQFWDPSYGAIYSGDKLESSLLEFQKSAVFGFYQLVLLPNNRLEMRVKNRSDTKLELTHREFRFWPIPKN